MRPSRREALVALASLPALEALLACSPAEREGRYEGEIVGGDGALGHRLLSGELLQRPPVRTEKVGTAILGAGIAGLGAAWRLRLAGDLDFQVLELEPEAGGTSRSGGNQVSRYPWAAHYVPVPVEPNPALEALLEEAGAVASRQASGRPVWAEEVLCADPDERLFFRGYWHEGLFPLAGASRQDLDELRRLEGSMRGFASARDAAGRRAFALPHRLSAQEPEIVALDRISMAEWLEREGYRSARLRWFVEYGCRDDFGALLGGTSAWAGIHYFAARMTGRPEEDEPAPFLTWPEGNGRLVHVLSRGLGQRLRTSCLVFDVKPSAEGVAIRFLDASRDEVVALEARDAVYAMPRFTSSRVIAPWRSAPPEHLSLFTYSPWLVANVTLRERPVERSFPLAWDNVLHDSPSLGYVVATHQTGRTHGPTVLTYYRPFPATDVAASRRDLLSASWEDLAGSVVAELSRAHRDLPSLASRVDVYRWGHAMAIPAPGTLFSRGREEARRPLGRVRFAHADISGLPLVEEALDAGVGAAEDILAARGESVRSLRP